MLYSIPLTRFLHIKAAQVSSSYLVKTILPISIGRAVAVSAAYFGLSRLAVSFSQTIKGTMPIFTILISRVVLGERQSGKVYLSLLPIVCGVAIASLTEIRFDTVGLLAALFSTCTFAWLNVLAKKVFEGRFFEGFEKNRFAQESKLTLLGVFFCFLQFTSNNSFCNLTRKCVG